MTNREVYRKFNYLLNLQPDLSGNPFYATYWSEKINFVEPKGLGALRQAQDKLQADYAAQINQALKPIFPIVFWNKCPNQNPANFLTLRHINSFEFRHVEVFEKCCQLMQIVFFGNQTRELKNLGRELRTFINHFFDERHFATFAP